MSKLYVHENHPHMPRNVNAAHNEEHEVAGFNTRLAVFLTKHVGTMQTAYSFVVLALVGLAGILGWLPAVALVLVAWFSQTFLQLVLLPVISVGQNVLGRHAELLADEQYRTTLKSYHQLGQIVKHLNAQDEELLKITARSSDVREMKSDIDRLTQLIEAMDRRLQALQKKATGA